MMKKKIFMLALVVVVVASMSVSAFAAETNMTEVLTASFTTMIADMMASIAAILPVVLPLFGVSMLVAFSIKWFKKIVTKT